MMNNLDFQLSFLNQYKDAGLLFLRIGIGLSFLTLHGWDKLVGGPEVWARYGDVMPSFDLEGITVFWGLMAALAESLGAVLFAIGLLCRPMAAVLGFTMIVAVYAHLSEGDSWLVASHALEMAFVFLGIMIVGPGKYSLDYRPDKKD